MSDSKPTSGFDRRSFMAGAAGAAVIPVTARAAGPAANVPVAQDPLTPVDVTLRVNGKDHALSLLEATEIDPRNARYVNDSLADYLLPVNADAPSVEVIMLSEQDDQVNPTGMKGLGELANVGTNAAVCNAIFHATGQRIRKLLVRLEHLEI